MEKIKARVVVDNATTSVTVEATVCVNASWKRYSDVACTIEIANKQLSLNKGANIAYIKVASRTDKYHGDFKSRV